MIPPKIIWDDTGTVQYQVYLWMHVARHDWILIALVAFLVFWFRRRSTTLERIDERVVTTNDETNTSASNSDDPHNERRRREHFTSLACDNDITATSSFLSPKHVSQLCIMVMCRSPVPLLYQHTSNVNNVKNSQLHGCTSSKTTRETAVFISVSVHFQSLSAAFTHVAWRWRRLRQTVILLWHDDRNWMIDVWKSHRIVLRTNKTWQNSAHCHFCVSRHAFPKLWWGKHLLSRNWLDS